MAESEKKSRKKLVLLILLALALIAAAVAVWALTHPKLAGGLEYEENVVVGALTESREERIAELNRQVAEGEVSISINATPCTASDGSGQVNWNIENPANQGKLIRVEVELEDTGDVIFSTGAIKPDSSLPTGKLDADLDPGTYGCVAMFYTYNLKTEEYIGRAGARITLTVG